MRELEEIRFLCSPLILKELLAALTRNETQSLEKSLREVLERERFHQSPFSLSRLEGLWEISQPSGRENRGPFFLSFLFYLAQKYFRWSFRLGLPVLREETVLSFQHLLGHLLVDQLWLFALACDFEDHTRLRLRRKIPSGWEEFFLPPVDDPILLELRRQGMVEVHRHLSGSLPPLFLWENFLRYWHTFIRDCFAPKNRRKWLSLLPPEINAEEFRFWICLIPALRGALLQKKTEYFERLCQALFYQDLQLLFSLNEEFHVPFSRQRHRIPGLGERYFLLERYREILSPEELPSNYKWWFYAYLLLQNHWLKLVVLPEKGEGFERFEKLAHAPTRDKLEDNAPGTLSVLLALERRNGVRSIEWRIKPYEKFPKFRQKLELISLISLIHKELRSFPKVGIVLHFIKDKDKNLDKLHEYWPIIPVRHFQLRRKLWQSAFNILRFKFSRKGSLILGLDAANNELYAPPEVFSPVIRFLRRRVSEEQTFLDSPDITPLALTFHAGESFRHLLSGLRYIDETLEFLEMQPGDRLGHALALGLDPEKWVRKNRGVILLPREEWLDNLVWFVHRLKEIGGFSEAVLRYEDEIFHHLHYIYDSKTDIESYFRVWKYLRREEALALENPYLDSFEPVCWLFQTRKSLPESDFELWKRYHLDWEVRRKAMEFIEVKVTSSLVEPLKALQEALLQKCIKRQVAIEINPSSNLIIGGLEDLTEHPVFRWLPPRADRRRALPWIVVGSDDPGIFQTQLWHEYIFLAYAAREKGTTPYEISSWLKELADNSSRFSFLANQ